jgi:hypothetical protein
MGDGIAFKQNAGILRDAQNEDFKEAALRAE